MTDHDPRSVSFSEFVSRSEPRLRRALCAAFGANRGREATAHALAAGWERWEDVRRKDNPIGYLYVIGRNYARRERGREARTTHVLPDVSEDVAPWVEPRLPGALAGLSDRQRTAVMLVHGLGWSHADVAEILGVTKSTVQTQAERGMRKLRRMMGAHSAKP